MVHQDLGLLRVEGSGGENLMQDSELKWRIVRRMWNDNIVGSSPADVDTIVDFAVPSSEEGRARKLLTNKMVQDPDCPVKWVIANQAVVLRKDEEAVAIYIKRHGGEDNVPWDLRDVLRDDTEDD